MADPGRYAFTGLDRLIHERARLGIMTSLMTAHDGLLFAELKGLCDLTDGNLNRHLHVLEEAGLVELEKSGSGRNKKTRIRVTDEGRTQFLQYLDELKQVVTDAAQAAQPNAAEQSLGWASG